MKHNAFTVKWIVLALAVVALLGAGALALYVTGGLSGPQVESRTASSAALVATPTARSIPPTPTLEEIDEPDDSEPNPADVDIAKATLPPEPTATPAPPTNTPVPPTATVEPTAVAVVPEPPPATPTPKKAAAKQAPAVAVLPNGVKYGERRPNLPNRIVRIQSPDIKLDTKVYEVYATKKGEWEVAEWAGGHHYNSKNPGEGGNIVLSGHNNWKGEVFRYLEFLKPGNTINVWTQDGKQYTYTVQEVNKVPEKGVSYAQRLENGKAMQPTQEEQLTLITCWPYKTFTHRIIVVARPVK